jgi:uncharacterized protein (TIGR02246 family)
MRCLTALALLLATTFLACASAPANPAAENTAIGALLDGWHAAAARADEEQYFAPFASDAVFLGTDATERWSTAAFRTWAHPHFAKGKAWSFRAVRRAITLGEGGAVAWFDEDLDTPNMGPARGSGVLVKREGRWQIAQYNLAITVPNERLAAVKRAAAGEAAPADAGSKPEVPRE